MSEVTKTDHENLREKVEEIMTRQAGNIANIEHLQDGEINIWTTLKSMGNTVDTIKDTISTLRIQVTIIVATISAVFGAVQVIAVTYIIKHMR